MAELPLSPEMMPQGAMPEGQAPVDDGTVTISITRDAEGNYSVEKESPAEEMTQEGAMPEEAIGNAVKARDLNEALKITQSMFEEGDAASAEALFAQGFTGDTQAAPAGKPPMM
jgi:predicted RNase H-like HicB family nuclease